MTPTGPDDRPTDGLSTDGLPTEDHPTDDHRAGFVGLVGRPNAGKSTLLNQVLGQKLSIVSDKPQTTRNRIVGIHTVPGMQAVLVDTPGIHAARSRLNKAMVQVATSAIQDVDAVCWVIDLVPATRAARAGRPPLSPAEQDVARMIAEAEVPHLSVALNKADLVGKPWILPVMAAVQELLPQAVIVPISALRGEGVPELVDTWRDQLPAGPPMYPADQFTEAPERFIVAELIREKIFHLTQQEIPYATAVEIELFEEEDGGDRSRVHIMARIYVERDSQKGIVIGKGGAMLKRIGTLARKEIQRLLGARVFLELHVSVRKHWTSSARALKELGYE
ncbi:MAG: GTPase Era [Deltaproteobacteria bacterium]|nr:MAG: GTPase Era [Deltaproteobacteria bacterium]